MIASLVVVNPLDESAEDVARIVSVAANRIIVDVNRLSVVRVNPNRNDSINNHSSSVTIDSSAGDDSIINGGNSVTISGGTGDDNIWNYSDSITIDGGDGNDFIYNEVNPVTVDGGAGNDSIHNSGAQSSRRKQFD